MCRGVGAYVVFEKPYDEVVDVLLEQYSDAVRQLTTASGERWMAGHPDEKLVEHLMVLYWRGKVGLEDSQSLIPEFYSVASDELRAYSVKFLTRLLENPEVQVSEDVLARLRDLWDFRGEIASEARVSELKAFAGFFASGQFEKRWALEQLDAALSLSGQVVLDRQLAEYLTDCVPEEPLLAVRCLRSTIEVTRESWRVSVRQASIRDVLTTAIQGTDQAARQEARELANRMVARGFADFQDLT